MSSNLVREIERLERALEDERYYSSLLERTVLGEKLSTKVMAVLTVSMLLLMGMAYFRYQYPVIENWTPRKLIRSCHE